MNRNGKIRKVLFLGLTAVTLMACSLSALPFLIDSSVVEREEAIRVEELGEEVVEEQGLTPTEQTQQQIIIESIPGGLADIYDAVVPGVVYIQVFSQFGSGSGSGFVVDKEGHIVTNYHVVQGADTIQVDFKSGLKVYAEVVGLDDDADLAVLKVDVPAEELFPLTLGSSADLRVGEGVIAIGNPYGLVGTITYGIVSAKGRTLESLRQADSGAFFTTGDIIQTDANINPGNSGGPLLNLRGEVVGVNRAIRTAGATNFGEPINTGIGFAISIDIVKRVVPALISEGFFESPYIGVSALESLNLLQQELLGITHNNGAYITNVVPGSPADIAGLIGGSNQPVEYQGETFTMPVGGDLIIAIDGEPVNVFGDLLSYLLLNKSPGDTVTMTVVRGGEEIDIELTLGSRGDVSQQ